MSPRQKRLSSDDILKILNRNGFKKISQKGSHQKWRNEINGHQVIVPYQKGKQLPIGTLKSIIEGSGLSKSIFE